MAAATSTATASGPTTTTNGPTTTTNGPTTNVNECSSYSPEFRHFPNRISDTAYVRVDEVQIKARILQLIEQVKENFLPVDENCDGGLYVGTAGVAYMFYYLVKSGNFPEMETEFLEQAVIYMKSAISHYDTEIARNQRPSVAFLTGAGGVYVLAAMVYHKLGDTKARNEYTRRYLSLGKICADIDFVDHGADELFVGRAGYLMGAMLLNRELQREVISSEQMFHLCQVTMESGRQFRKKIKINVDIPLMYHYHGTTYLGAAHGVSGIFQTLLSVRNFVRSDKKNVAEIYKTIDFLMLHCIQNGNLATNFQGALMPLHRKLLVHWCHGAAGVIYMFARAYLVSKDERYFQVCREMAEIVWKEGLLTKGPGLCHGIAGNGYVHLLMYRLKRDQKYLHRALVFAEFMFTEKFAKEANVPDRPYSLFEGWAGTICYLNDMLNPLLSEFPLVNMHL